MTAQDAALAADSLRENILLAQANRQARQAEKLRLQRERQRPAYAADRNQVKPLGADGPIRLRGNFQAGGVPNGSPLAVSQGLGMSQPATRSTGAVDLSGLQEAIRQLRQLLGARYITAEDPNSPLIEARFEGELIVSETSGNWVWNSVLNGGEWQQGGGGNTPVVYNFADPNTAGVTPIEGFCYDNTAQRLFVANSAGNAWEPTASKVFLEGGWGAGHSTDTYYDGDIYLNAGGCLAVYGGGVWNEVSTGCAESPGPPSGGGGSSPGGSGGF